MQLQITKFFVFIKNTLIFGPIAGGDTIPPQLKNNFSIRGKIREF